MSTEAETAQGLNVFCLSGDLSVRDVRQTHAALCEAMVSEGRLEIDASQLTSVDTAVVQLLLAASRTVPGTVIKLPAEPDVTNLLAQIGANTALSAVI